MLENRFVSRGKCAYPLCSPSATHVSTYFVGGIERIVQIACREYILPS